MASAPPSVSVSTPAGAPLGLAARMSVMEKLR
jgi:hypothetical protein